MKLIILTLSFLFAFSSAQATIRYVGTGQQYTSIQAAINDCIDGDTVRILPGSYQEQVTIASNIVVQGGGALNTFIVDVGISSGAAVTMTSGKLQWISVTSSNDGVHLANGTVTNCIITSCANTGLVSTGTNAVVLNCIAASNGAAGFLSPAGTTLTATNCIALSNAQGFYACGGCGGSGNWGVLTARYCDSYGNNSNFLYVTTQVSCQQVNPNLSPDYRIAANSQLSGTGDPSLLNLDGSPSDMGYYGGPDAPLLPYVTLPSNIMLNADGTIQFNMVGKVGY